MQTAGLSGPGTVIVRYWFNLACHKNGISIFRSACRSQRRVGCLRWSDVRPFFPYIVWKQCRLQACLNLELSSCDIGSIWVVTKTVFPYSNQPVDLSDVLGVCVGRVYVRSFLIL